MHPKTAPHTLTALCCYHPRFNQTFTQPPFSLPPQRSNCLPAVVLLTIGGVTAVTSVLAVTSLLAVAGVVAMHIYEVDAVESEYTTNGVGLVPPPTKL